MSSTVALMLRRLDAEKARFIEEMNAFPEKKLIVQPGPMEWSAVQIMEHVLIAQYSTLSYMMKKTSSGWEKIPYSNIDNQHNSDNLQSNLGAGQRWTAPQLLPDPGGVKSREDMISDWERIQGKCHKFFTELEPEYQLREIFRHPTVGYLNMWQTLEFLIIHIPHHLAQLKRLRVRLGID